jgi:hypothetical protein
VREPRIYGLVAGGGLVLAALLVVVGHVDPNNDLNPWALTVSDFAVSDRGGVTDVAMGVVAAVTVTVLVGLRRAGTQIGAWANGLLAVWAGGLLLAAIVPTNEPGLPLTTGGYVHRYASVAAFLALPVGGWMLAKRLPSVTATRWVRRLAVVSLACAAAMVWSAFPGGRVLIGLAERLLILAETCLLATVATTLLSRCRATRSPTGLRAEAVEQPVDHSFEDRAGLRRRGASLHRHPREMGVPPAGDDAAEVRGQARLELLRADARLADRLRLDEF